MKIGYSSRWKFLEKEMNLFEELDFAHSLGFEVFGLNLDRPQNRSLTKQQLTKLKTIADQYKIQFVVRCPHHINTSINSTQLYHEIEKYLKIAKALGSDRLMIHPGSILNRLELDFDTSKQFKGKTRTELGIPETQIKAQFQQLIKNLQKIVLLSKKQEITIGLENNGEYYQFGSNLKEYQQILSLVPGLKASISIGHANISGNNLYEYITTFKDKIINLDIHDNHGEKDEHLPIGDGNINFKKIFEALNHTENLTLLVDTYTDEFVKRSLINLYQILKTIR